MGGTYGSFYTNICRFLSTLHGGIKHRRPSVRLPLSKVGLELSAILANLGVIHDYSVGQAAGRVKAHGRLWDAAAAGRVTSSSQAAGYPAMTLTLHLHWDRHRPLWDTATPLAAAPNRPAPLGPAGGGGGGSGAAAEEQAADAAAASRLLSEAFSAPMGLNAPTPEAVRILSRPSAQCWVGRDELLRLRRATRPGLFLLSTTQGLLTDIDCELRGIGGVLLAHLALPLGHVTALRGLLRAKHSDELAAAAAGQHQHQQQQQQHVPLAAWDARRQVLASLLPRLAGGHAEAVAYLAAVEQRSHAAAAASRDGAAAGGGDEPLARYGRLLGAARQQLLQLEMQELAWRQQHGGAQEAAREAAAPREGAREGAVAPAAADGRDGHGGEGRPRSSGGGGSHGAASSRSGGPMGARGSAGGSAAGGGGGSGRLRRRPGSHDRWQPGGN